MYTHTLSTASYAQAPLSLFCVSGGTKLDTSVSVPLLRLQSSEGKFTTSLEIEPVRRSLCRRRSCTFTDAARLVPSGRILVRQAPPHHRCMASICPSNRGTGRLLMPRIPPHFSAPNRHRAQFLRGWRNTVGNLIELFLGHQKPITGLNVLVH